MPLIELCLVQLTVTGGGSASPATVNFPGAYKSSDPGILVNIHSAMSSYANPGPAVYSGGSTKVSGSQCSGVEAGTGTGPIVTPTGGGSTGGGGDTGGGGGCTSPKYGQCGGQGWTGCTACEVSFLTSALPVPNLLLYSLHFSSFPISKNHSGDCHSGVDGIKLFELPRRVKKL